MAISITKPTVGGSEDTWGDQLNTALDTIVNAVNGTSGTTAPNLTGGSWKIDGVVVTASAAELNKLDTVTVGATEFNRLSGVSSNIQTQLNAKAPTASPTFTGTATLPTASITTANITTANITTANITTVDLGAWTISESAGVLYFKSGGVNKMKIDASGNLTVTGNVNTNGTV